MRLAIHGASGYTGRLVTAETARRGIEFVLVGRDAQRLLRAAEEVGIPEPQVRVADVDHPRTLVDAFGDCDAVVNCAGPFVLWGKGVVRAAVDARSHYVDISGEQLFIKSVFDTFANDAERAGVTIVPAANDDGLPSDLLAHLVADEVDTVDDIAIAIDLVSGGRSPSRGTLRSALASIDTFKSGGLSYQDGDWRSDSPQRRASMLFPGNPDAVGVVKFALPAVITVPRHVPARYVEGLAKPGLAAAFAAITPELVETVRDQGPNQEDRQASRWTLVVDAICPQGRRVRGTVQGSDTYGTTAVVAVEAARRLAAGAAPPGVLAPAAAFDANDFLNFLAPHGVRWAIDTADGSPPASPYGI